MIASEFILGCKEFMVWAHSIMQDSSSYNLGGYCKLPHLTPLPFSLGKVSKGLPKHILFNAAITPAGTGAKMVKSKPDTVKNPRAAKAPRARRCRTTRLSSLKSHNYSPPWTSILTLPGAFVKTRFIVSVVLNEDFECTAVVCRRGTFMDHLLILYVL